LGAQRYKPFSTPQNIFRSFYFQYPLKTSTSSIHCTQQLTGFLFKNFPRYPGSAKIQSHLLFSKSFSLKSAKKNKPFSYNGERRYNTFCRPQKLRLPFNFSFPKTVRTNPFSSLRERKDSASRHFTKPFANIVFGNGRTSPAAVHDNKGAKSKERR
jgi:hypothetical protein